MQTQALPMAHHRSTWIIKLSPTRMKTDKLASQTYTSSFDCVRKIYKAQGVRGLSVGLWTTMLRDTPSFGSYFVTYEVTCQFFHNFMKRRGGTDEHKYVSTPVMLFAGGLAGAVSWLVTYPLDVIKTRLQADLKGQYRGLLHCAKESVKREGWRVLLTGLSSTLLRAFPSSAATFAAVTWIIRWTGREETFDSHIAEIMSPNHKPDSLDHYHQLALLTNFPSHP